MFLESQLLDAKKVKRHVITVVVSRLVPATPRFYLATVKKNSIWLLLDKIWELAWEQDQVLSLSRQKIVFPSPKCPPDVQTACLQILMCRRHNTRCSYVYKFLGNLILLCYTKITAYFSMYVLKKKKSTLQYYEVSNVHLEVRSTVTLVVAMRCFHQQESFAPFVCRGGWKLVISDTRSRN